MISTKGRYGIRAIVDLIINLDKENVTLKAIAERQEISERYLEQIFSILRKAGIIIGRKGAQGGYILAKAPKEVTLAELLIALEGDLFFADKNNDITCNDIERFLENNLWKEINNKVHDYFRSITLEEIVEKFKSESEDIMYYI